MNDKQHFGTCLDALMRQRGLTTYALAQQWSDQGEIKSMIRSWRLGRHAPSYANLRKLQRLLDCEWSEFFEPIESGPPS